MIYLLQLTMQQAILRHFPDTQATYAFTLRNKSAVFTEEAVNAFREAVNRMHSMISQLTVINQCPIGTFRIFCVIIDLG